MAQRVRPWAVASRKWYLDRKYRDPIQRRAQEHIHSDLTEVQERVANYCQEHEPVRRQVVLELHERVERRLPGNFASAVSGFVAVAGTTVTIVAAFLFALFNGWFGLVIKLTDPATGQAIGVDSAQVGQTFGSYGSTIFGLAIVLVVGGLLWISIAGSRDRERAVYSAWKQAFEQADVAAARPQHRKYRRRRLALLRFTASGNE